MWTHSTRHNDIDGLRQEVAALRAEIEGIKQQKRLNALMFHLACWMAGLATIFVLAI